MPHQASVFGQILKQVPWADFDDLVAEHGSDWRVRRLPTKSQFVALLYAQLSGAESLREITTGLESHRARLYHLGARPVQRSTLADANAKRPSDVFAGLFAALSGRLHRGLRRRVEETTYLLDATTVRVSGLGSDWAHFSHKMRGAKAHIVYDPDADCPVYSVVTPARTNDVAVAQALPIEPGATYVFDLGYYDFRWWLRLHEAKCRIVTRFKANTPLEEAVERPLAGDCADILSDREGRLPRRQAKQRRNPFSDPVREITVRIETGKTLRILTNDLTAPAREIADLYKRRWAIELFFRWIKQTLKIRKFLGNSENAVRIQIAVALIAYLLLRLAQETQSAVKEPLRFARLIRANLFHGKRLDRLLEPEKTSFPDPRQMVLHDLQS